MAKNHVIKLYRGAYSGLPTLGAGELAFTTDTKEVYAGDGAANNLIGGTLQGVLSSRPTAGQQRRYYFATDTNELYYDNGTTWTKIYSSTTAEFQRRKAVIALADPTAAPPTENTGDRYALDFDAGTIDAGWDGAAKGDIVEFDGASWVVSYTSIEGTLAYSDSDNKDLLRVNDGTDAWEKRPVAITLHNDFSDLQGGTTDEYYHMTQSEHTAVTGKVHDRQHALDSTADHTGISGTTGNLMALDANGLPTDSGSKPADFEAAFSKNTAFNKDYGTGESKTVDSSSTNADGTSADLARADHEHNLGDIDAGTW